MAKNNENKGNIIVRGHRPTSDLDSSKPPLGGSVVTKQLQAIRQAANSFKTSAHKK